MPQRHSKWNERDKVNLLLCQSFEHGVILKIVPCVVIVMKHYFILDTGRNFCQPRVMH